MLFRSVTATGISVLKSGLPGEETVTEWSKTDATDADIVSDPIAIVVGAVRGGSISSGVLTYYRVFGLVLNQAITGVVDGAVVYVSDAGVVDDSAGSNSRKCGRVVNVPSANVAHVYFNGLGG